MGYQNGTISTMMSSPDFIHHFVGWRKFSRTRRLISLISHNSFGKSSPPQNPHHSLLFTLLTLAFASTTCILILSITMKLSKSFARLVPGTHKTEVQHDRSLQRKRSSLDNLIIPRRTRLPSSKVSQVEPIDLQIAMNLLNAQAHALPATRSSTAASISEGTRQSCDVSATESDGPQTLSQSSGSFWFRNDTRNGSFAGDERHLNGGEDHHSTLVARKQSSSSSSGRWEHHGLGMTYDGPNDFAGEESSLTSLTLPSINDSAIDVLRAGPAESAEKYNTLAALHGLSQSDVIQDHG